MDFPELGISVGGGGSFKAAINGDLKIRESRCYCSA